MFARRDVLHELTVDRACPWLTRAVGDFLNFLAQLIGNPLGVAHERLRLHDLLHNLGAGQVLLEGGLC